MPPEPIIATVLESGRARKRAPIAPGPVRVRTGDGTGGSRSARVELLPLTPPG